jgi:hypothetical protein
LVSSGDEHSATGGGSTGKLSATQKIGALFEGRIKPFIPPDDVD